MMKKAMATHSSILAWKIPWTEEPGRLQFMGSRRVGHNWVTSLSFFQDTTGSIPGSGRFPWSRKREPTPVFLPGKFHEQRSLTGHSLWGRRVGHDWVGSRVRARARTHTSNSKSSSEKWHQYYSNYIDREFRNSWKTYWYNIWRICITEANIFHRIKRNIAGHCQKSLLCRAFVSLL